MPHGLWVTPAVVRADGGWSSGHRDLPTFLLSWISYPRKVIPKDSRELPSLLPLDLPLKFPFWLLFQCPVYFGTWQHWWFLCVAKRAYFTTWNPNPAPPTTPCGRVCILNQYPGIYTASFDLLLHQLWINKSCKQYCFGLANFLHEWKPQKAQEPGWWFFKPMFTLSFIMDWDIWDIRDYYRES